MAHTIPNKKKKQSDNLTEKVYKEPAEDADQPIERTSLEQDDTGRVVAHSVEDKDGDVAYSAGSQDAQLSGEYDKFMKKRGKKGEKGIVYTTPSLNAEGERENAEAAESEKANLHPKSKLGKSKSKGLIHKMKKAQSLMQMADNAHTQEGQKKFMSSMNYPEKSIETKMSNKNKLLQKDGEQRLEQEKKKLKTPSEKQKMSEKIKTYKASSKPKQDNSKTLEQKVRARYGLNKAGKDLPSGLSRDESGTYTLDYSQMPKPAEDPKWKQRRRQEGKSVADASNPQRPSQSVGKKAEPGGTAAETMKRKRELRKGDVVDMSSRRKKQSQNYDKAAEKQSEETGRGMKIEQALNRQATKRSKKKLKKDDKPHPPGSPKDSAHDVVEEGSELKAELKNFKDDGKQAMVLKHLRNARGNRKEWKRSPANQKAGLDMNKSNDINPDAWYVKHKGDWHKVVDVQDDGKPFDQGGGNWYHVEGKDKPIHQSEKEGLASGRQLSEKLNKNIAAGYPAPNMGGATGIGALSPTAPTFGRLGMSQKMKKACDYLKKEQKLSKKRGVPKGVSESKYERCVRDVKKKKDVDNPYAVCGASLKKARNLLHKEWKTFMD